MVTCYLGIGSNLGNKRANIKAAIKKIGLLKSTKVLKCSRLIKTKAAGGVKNQPDYLNGALRIKTGLSPLKLLGSLKKIEAELGRPKKHQRFGPRVIDLDILFYAFMVISRKDLIVPHPRLFEREFVMRPLSEIYEGN